MIVRRDTFQYHELSYLTPPISYSDGLRESTKITQCRLLPGCDNQEKYIASITGRRLFIWNVSISSYKYLVSSYKYSSDVTCLNTVQYGSVEFIVTSHKDNCVRVIKTCSTKYWAVRFPSTVTAIHTFVHGGFTICVLVLLKNGSFCVWDTSINLNDYDVFSRNIGVDWKTEETVLHSFASLMVRISLPLYPCAFQELLFNCNDESEPFDGTVVQTDVEGLDLLSCPFEPSVVLGRAVRPTDSPIEHTLNTRVLCTSRSRPEAVVVDLHEHTAIKLTVHTDAIIHAVHCGEWILTIDQSGFIVRWTLDFQQHSPFCDLRNNRDALNSMEGMPAGRRDEPTDDPKRQKTKEKRVMVGVALPLQGRFLFLTVGKSFFIIGAVPDSTVRLYAENVHDSLITCASPMITPLQSPDGEGYSMLTGSTDGVIKVWGLLSEKYLKDFAPKTSGPKHITSSESLANSITEDDRIDTQVRQRAASDSIFGEAFHHDRSKYATDSPSPSSTSSPSPCIITNSSTPTLNSPSLLGITEFQRISGRKKFRVDDVFVKKVKSADALAELRSSNGLTVGVRQLIPVGLKTVLAVYSDNAVLWEEQLAARRAKFDVLRRLLAHQALAYLNG